MNRDYPEIEDLLDGINDPNNRLAMEQTFAPVQKKNTAKETIAAQAEPTIPDTPPVSSTPEAESMQYCWQAMLDILQHKEPVRSREDRVYCKLDRDLADSIDDCCIFGRSRTEIVNAIVRVYVTTFLPQLAEYRRESISLLRDLKTARP